MAHFAEIMDGRVTRVLVLENSVIATDKGNDSETKGKKFLQGIFGSETEWVQTSLTASFRGKFAGQGDIWDGSEFTTPKQPNVDPVTS
jgi:hypothetical protein